MTILQAPGARAEEAAATAPTAPGPLGRSVLDLIGNTPLVPLGVLSAGTGATVLVKLESRNPGGSSKDRTALNMVREAEASGALVPGGTIVESTSGNTGIGLALVGRVTGHPVVIVHSASTSKEKLAVLRGYGAELVEADWNAGPDDPGNPRAVAQRIAANRRDAWWSSQFLNAANPGAHYRGTGPEVWEQTHGRVSHFVAGIGTGGTLSGTGRFLKDASSGRVRVIGADPVGSTYSGSAAGPISVEGVGTAWSSAHWPASFDPSVADEVRQIDNERAYSTMHALARDEALLLGPSSGLAIALALEVAREAPRGSVVVVVAPDSGLNYLSTAYNDEWLEAAGIESRP